MEAQEYLLIDRVYGNFISFQEKIKPLVKEHNPNSTLAILELGCGTGVTTEIILTAREGIKLTSIDISKEMIGFAKQNLSSFANVSFIVSDVLEFIKKQKLNDYDIIVSAYTIHNLTNEYRLKLYTEIFRTLKPKGLFINADKFSSDDKDKQIEGLKYRLGTYVDTLMREDKHNLLKEWIIHYIDDQHPNKILRFNQTISDLKEFVDAHYIFKSEIEMLGILVAHK